MSLISDDSIRNEEIFSNLGDDIENEIIEETNEQCIELNFHIANLEKELIMIRNIYELPKSENWEKNLNKENCEYNQQIIEQLRIN